MGFGDTEFGDTEFGATSPQAVREQPDKKFFTVEEANRALPLVSRVVADIRKQYRITMELDQAYQAVVERRDDAHTPDALSDQREAALDRLNELVEELAEIGVELKDWESGLVDFPCLRQAREVCLCWKAGEKAVGYWHEQYAGFAGREEITESFESQ